MTTLGELVDQVRELLDCSPADAMRVAADLYTEDREYTQSEIAYVASKLDIGPREDDEPQEVTPTSEMELDPAKVLQLMYERMPRVLAHETPKLGRAPKESEFFRGDERAEILEALPEDTKLLLGSVDVFNGLLTFTVYDEANDLDREVGPIDLSRYTTARELDHGLRTLLSRLESRVLPADHN